MADATGTYREEGAVGTSQPPWREGLTGLIQTLSIPYGFTLSIAGTVAITLGHTGNPGPLPLWLFVVGGAMGFCFLVLASRAHRPQQPGPVTARGLALLNVMPVLTVPVGVGVSWWISNDYLAYAMAGLVTVPTYLLLVATLLTALQ